MLTVVRYTDAALAVSWAFFLTGTTDCRIVHAHRLDGSFRFIPVKDRHAVRKVYGQLY